MTLVEIAVAYVLGVTAGVGAGWFSYRHQALFIGGVMAALAGLSAIGSKLAPLLKVGAATTGVGFVQMPGYLFALLPMHMQNAVWLCFIVAVLARIVTWYVMRNAPEKEAESKADRRNRLYREFNYSDPLVDAYADKGQPAGGSGTGRSRGSAQNGGKNIRSLAGL